MTTKSSAPQSAAKKKTLLRIAVAQRQADLAKKASKLAKLGLRQAKLKFKDAKRAARKFRKAAKALKSELIALSVKKPARKTVSRKVATKRVRPAKVETKAMTAEVAPLPGTDLPPLNPPAQ